MLQGAWPYDRVQQIPHSLHSPVSAGLKLAPEPVTGCRGPDFEALCRHKKDVTDSRFQAVGPLVNVGFSQYISLVQVLRMSSTFFVQEMTQI